MKTQRLRFLNAQCALLALTAWLNFQGLSQTPGELDLTFKPDLTDADGLNASLINAIALQADGKILIGGSLRNKDGSLRQSLERLNRDGSVDSSFHPNPWPTQVQAVLVQADGRILVGGYTSSPTNAPRAIVRLNPDGTLDESFQAGAGPDSLVLSLAEQPDGKILVGGGFRSVAGVPRNALARLEPGGALDTGFSGLESTNALVKAMALQSDGKILLSGFFPTSPHTDEALVRVNADGTVDPSFQLLSLWTYVDDLTCLAVQSDNKIMAGFLGMDLNSFNGLLRLNRDGSLDPSFTPIRVPVPVAVGPYIFGMPFVNAVVVQKDGKLLVGGGFTSVNGLRHRGVVRANPDGTLDESFTTGSGPGGLVNPFSNPFVTVLQLQADGQLLVGGQFTTFNGKPPGSLVRLAAEAPLHFGGPQLASGLFQASVYNLLGRRVRIESSTDGQTWKETVTSTNDVFAVTSNPRGSKCLFYRAVAP